MISSRSKILVEETESQRVKRNFRRILTVSPHIATARKTENEWKED